MKNTDHINLLGLKAKDAVTGFSGVVTSISFDLYGCVQAIVTPPVDKDGNAKDGRWFDIIRLHVKRGITSRSAAQPWFIAHKRRQRRRSALGKIARRTHRS